MKKMYNTLKPGIMKKIFLLPVLFLGILSATLSQDAPADKSAPAKKRIKATFNSTKIINMQSVEMVGKSNLQFMVSHHFSSLWTKDGGSQNLGQFFGINSGVAQTYLSFDYSPANYLNLGLAMAGRSRYEGWAKFRILRQETGGGMPVSLGWYSMAHVNTAKDPDISFSWNKWSFLHQILVARKFSDRFSMQLMPTVVHFNEIPYGINNSNMVYSIGLAGKYKMSAKKNLTFEYSRQLNMHQNLIDKSGTIVSYNPDLISLGLELNTGGHLFQFYVGNTVQSSAIEQLARNPQRPDASYSLFNLSNVAFGFTINRVMSLKKDKE